jgi:hypothetical protein
VGDAWGTAIAITSTPNQHPIHTFKNLLARLFRPQIYIKKTNQYFHKNADQVMIKAILDKASAIVKANEC